MWGVGAGARRRSLRLRGALRPSSAPGRWEEGPPGRLAGRGAARRGPARPARAAQNGRRGPASGPPPPQAAGGAGRGLTCRPSPSGTARSRPPPGASRVGMDRRDGTVGLGPRGARGWLARGRPGRPSGRIPPSRQGRRPAISRGPFSHPCLVLPSHRSHPLTFPRHPRQRVPAGLTCAGVVSASPGVGHEGSAARWGWGGRSDVPGRGEWRLQDPRGR